MVKIGAHLRKLSQK